MIYLDNAATTLRKPDCVIEAVAEAMRSSGNAGHGVNEASLRSLRTVTHTRELLAELVNFPYPERVCFTSNVTEALNTAIHGLFPYLREPRTDVNAWKARTEKAQEECCVQDTVYGGFHGLRGKRHVITTNMEHNSVLRPLRHLEQFGQIRLTILPAGPQGVIRPEDLQQMIQPDTAAVVMTHASNVTGNVTDLAAIGSICLANDVLFVVDAAQTAGVIPIDMQAMHIDILCLTGHKSLMGPQGTGAILVGKDVYLEPLKSGGTGILSYNREQPESYPEHLEAGTLNTHGIAGLEAALEELKRIGGVEKIRAEEISLAKEFFHRICRIPGVKVYGNMDPERDECWEQRVPIVTLNIGDYDSAAVAEEMMERFGIAVRSGAHCAPLCHEAMGTAEQGAVRFSFSRMNTMEEVTAAAEAVRILATEDRQQAEDNECRERNINQWG